MTIYMLVNRCDVYLSTPIQSASLPCGVEVIGVFSDRAAAESYQRYLEYESGGWDLSIRPHELDVLRDPRQEHAHKGADV